MLLTRPIGFAVKRPDHSVTRCHTIILFLSVGNKGDGDYIQVEMSNENTGGVPEGLFVNRSHFSQGAYWTILSTSSSLDCE